MGDKQFGIIQWQALLRIRKRSLAGKARDGGQLRREAIERQELMITVAGIVVLLLFNVVGSALYLDYMGWLDIRDYFR